MAKAEGLAGGKAPVKAFSSKLLQMKFMQRRATQAAAAKQETQVCQCNQTLSGSVSFLQVSRWAQPLIALKLARLDCTDLNRKRLRRAIAENVKSMYKIPDEALRQ